MENFTCAIHFQEHTEAKKRLSYYSYSHLFWKERCGSSSEADTCSLILQNKQHCRMTLAIREGEACGLARQKQTYVFPCAVLRVAKSNSPVSELG
jgi:hypothetical protein